MNSQMSTCLQAVILFIVTEGVKHLLKTTDNRYRQQQSSAQQTNIPVED